MALCVAEELTVEYVAVMRDVIIIALLDRAPSRALEAVSAEFLRAASARIRVLAKELLVA